MPTYSKPHLMNLYLCLGLLLTLTGCESPGTKIGGIFTPVPDYQCLPVPSTFNEVGSMFSVDKTGFTQRLGKVDGIKEKKGEAHWPDYTYNSTFKTELFISTLEDLTNLTGLSGKIDANKGNELHVKSKYKDTQLFVTEGQPEEQAITWFKKELKSRPGEKYYLVTEALKANAVDYELTRKDFAKLGGEVKFKKAVEGKLTAVDRKSDDSIVMRATFSKPLNVCIKPRELALVTSGATGVKTYELKPVDHRIEITDVKSATNAR